MNKRSNKSPKGFNPLTIIRDDLAGVSYESREDGLFKIIEKRARTEMRLGEPLDVLAIGSRVDGSNASLFLRFVADGDWVYKRLPLSSLANGDTVLKALLSFGYAVESLPTGRKKNDLAEYLYTVFKCHRNELKKLTLVDSVGWLDDSFSVYVRPNDVTGASGSLSDSYVFSPLANDSQVLADWLAPSNEESEAGTLKDWNGTIGQMALSSSRMAFALCCAFSAPLLRPLGGESTVFHFVGESGKGKTAFLNASRSVWGSHSEYFSNWACSTSALEAWASGLSDCLGVKDEMKQMSDEVAEQIPYLIGNEHGKERANANLELRDPIRFKLILLSVGEIGLSERRGKKRIAEGEYGRFVDLPAVVNNSVFGVFDSLPSGYKTSGEAVDAVFEYSRMQYGTPSKAFLQALIVDIQKRGLSAFRNEYREFTKRFIESLNISGNSLYQRMAKRFAVVAFGGELAIRYGVLCWPGGTAQNEVSKCFHLWADGGSSPQVRATQYLTALREHPARFKSRYCEFHLENPYTATSANTYEELGTIVKDEDGRIIFSIYNNSGLRVVMDEINAPTGNDLYQLFSEHCPTCIVETGSDRGQYRPMAERPPFGMLKGQRVSVFFFGNLDTDEQLNPKEIKRLLSKGR